MVLPKGLFLSVGIIPFERVIRSMYEEDISVDEELMEELQMIKIIIFKSNSCCKLNLQQLFPYFKFF